MNQGAPRRLHAANAPSCPRRDRDPRFRTGDLRIVEQLDRLLRVVQQFNESRPVVQQRELHRPAELLAVLLELLLGERRADLVTDIQPSERVRAIDARWVVQVHRELAPLLGIRELQIRPWLDVLADVFRILIAREVDVRTVGLHQSELAVVQLECPVVGHGTEKACGDHPGRGDHVEVLREEALLSEGDGKLGELQHLVRHRENRVSFGLGQRFAESTRYCGNWVNALSRHDVEHLSPEVPVAHHLLSDLGVRLGYANDVSHRVVTVRAHDVVGPCEEEEVEDVFLRKGNGVA